LPFLTLKISSKRSFSYILKGNSPELCMLVYNPIRICILLPQFEGSLWPWSYAISAYHHWCCGFDYHSERGVQHYVIKFVSDLRQVGGFLWVLWFPPPIKLTQLYIISKFWLSRIYFVVLNKSLCISTDLTPFFSKWPSTIVCIYYCQTYLTVT
jgi:hypothetical protein